MFKIFLLVSLLFCTGDMVNEIFTSSITSTGSQRSQSFKRKYVSDDHWTNDVSQKKSQGSINRFTYISHTDLSLIFLLPLL